MIMVARKMAIEGQIGFPENEITSIAYWDHFAAKGPDGLYYMKWGLGQSLVEIPFLVFHRFILGMLGPEDLLRDQTRFYLTEFAFLMLCPSVISALGCVLFYLLSLRLGFSRKVSVLLTLIYGLGTMVWPYSKSFMSETTLNVAILGGAYGAVQYVAEKRWHWMVVSGACMGFAVVTKVTALLIVPVIVVYLVASVKTKAIRLGLFCSILSLPSSAFLALQAWHNLIRYGSVVGMGLQGRNRCPGV